MLQCHQAQVQHREEGEDDHDGHAGDHGDVSGVLQVQPSDRVQADTSGDLCSCWLWGQGGAR